MTWRPWSGVLLLGLLAACEDTGPNISGVDGMRIESVRIQPAADTIFIPDTVRITDRLQLRATATSINSTTIDISRYVWSTSDSTVARVDSFGLVTPVHAGSVVISASATRIGTAVVVVAPISQRVQLTPRSDTIFVDDPIMAKDTVRIVAETFDSDGLRVTGIRYTWQSSVPAVATIDSTGKVRAAGLGATAITVRTSGSQVIGSISVLPVLSSVVITEPVVAQALAGDTVQLAVRAFSYAGAVIPRQFVWRSLNSAVGTVDTTGRAVLLAPGTVSFTATSAFRADTVSITVLPRTLQSVDVGRDYACGVGSLGRAWCWGKGTVGQLGSAADSTCFDDDGISARRACALAPKRMLRPELVFAQIAAGDSTACGVTTAQLLYCWGSDVLGAIGNGTGSGGAMPALATVAAERFSSVTSGGGHACALNVGGFAYCWGRDEAGQLGDAQNVHSTTPIPVRGPVSARDSLLRYSAVSAGGVHTCGVATDGSIWCWGSNTSGQLGLGAGSPASSSQPARVQGTVGHLKIAAGARHTCALTVVGEVSCWGSNSLLQLGNTGVTTSQTPLSVGTGFIDVVAGDEHSCGLRPTGQIACWGSNSHGQLGNGSSSAVPSATPVTVSGGVVFRSLAAGRRNTCAVSTEQVTWCWGSNMLGTLGNQLQAANEPLPQRVAPPR